MTDNAKNTETVVLGGLGLFITLAKPIRSGYHPSSSNEACDWDPEILQEPPQSQTYGSQRVLAASSHNFQVKPSGWVNLNTFLKNRSFYIHIIQYHEDDVKVQIISVYQNVCDLTSHICPIVIALDQCQSDIYSMATQCDALIQLQCEQKMMMMIYSHGRLNGLSDLWR